MLITLGRVSADERDLVNQDQLIVLLSYLALQGPTNRDAISRLFWPNSTNAGNNLSSALTRLRVANPHAVNSYDGLISTSMHVDAAELIQDSEAHRHRNVARRYGGAFLRGYYLPRVGAELEQWIYSMRETLAKIALRSSLALHQADDSDPLGSQLAERALEAVDIATLSTEELKQLSAMLDNSTILPARYLNRAIDVNQSNGSAELRQNAVPGCKIAIVSSEDGGRRIVDNALQHYDEIDLLFPGKVRDIETNFQGSGTVLYEQVLAALRIPFAPELEPSRWGKLLSTRPALLILHDVNPTQSVRTAIRALADCQLSLIAISSAPLAPLDFDVFESDDAANEARSTQPNRADAWDALAPTDMVALRQMALFSGWFSFSDLEALTDVAPRTLVNLQERELVQTHAGRLRLPHVIKEQIELRTPGAASNRASEFRARLIDHLKRTTENLDSLPWSGRLLRSDLREDFEHLWDFLIDQEDWDQLESIAFAYYKYLVATGDVAGLTRQFSEALEVLATAACPPSSLSGLRPTLNCALAWGYLAQRRDLDAALICSRSNDDAFVTSPVVAIDFDRIRALLFKRAEDFRAAVALLELTVEKIHATIQPGPAQMRLTAQVYLELGQNLRLLNEVQRASFVLRSALDIARELGDVGLESAAYLELSKTTSLFDPALGAVHGAEASLLLHGTPPARIHVALLLQSAESKFQDGYPRDCSRQATRAYHLGLDVPAYDLAAESLLLRGLAELTEGAGTASDSLQDGFAAAVMLCDSHVVERASRQIVATIAGNRREFTTLSG